MSKPRRGKDNNVPLPEVKINDIINERKTVRKLKAVQKRQTDQQRIRYMRSTTGIDPLQRFPKEIWMTIFDELDPEDKGSMWQLHPLFRGLLEKNRIRDILFPQILKVKGFQDSLSADFPHEEHLRLVSKSIRNCFDSLMEDEVKKRIQECEADSTPHFEDILSPLLDYDEEDDDRGGPQQLKRLLESFTEGANPGKRFYQRGLGVYLPRHGTENEAIWHHLRDVTKLLKIIGSQIWNFRFLLLNIQLDCLEKIYLVFQEMICLMPNLKLLEVLIRPKILHDPRGSKKRANKMPMLISQSILQNHQFPKLIHLERLSFYSGKSGGFHNIYEAILQENQHIKWLDVSDWDKTGPPNLPIVQPHLTHSLKLTGFTVHDDNFNSPTGSPTILRRIQPIMKHTWPLKNITLNLCSDPSRSDHTLIKLLHSLNTFPTLEKVNYSPMTGFIIGGDTEKFGYLKLPNLVDFQLILEKPIINYESKNVHFFFSLQFLLHCEKLETIYFDMRGFDDMKLRRELKKYERENLGKVVGFRAGLRILYDSNMWKVFPSLKSINVRNKREGADYTCSHEYTRALAMEGLSITELLKIHRCSSRGILASCTALLD